MLVRLSTGLGGLLVALSLGGCMSTGPQEFAVTGTTPPAPAGTMFRTSDANVNDVQARAYCAGGYDKLGEATLDTDGGGHLSEWRVRCNADLGSYLPF